MAITEFGKAVRKARIECGENLTTMAEALGATAGFLSGLETGRKKISSDWVKKIDGFFKSRGVSIHNLAELADEANGMTVFSDNLSFQQKLMVAGFAQSRFSADQLKQIAALFEALKIAQQQEASLEKEND